MRLPLSCALGVGQISTGSNSQNAAGEAADGSPAGGSGGNTAAGPPADPAPPPLTTPTRVPIGPPSAAPVAKKPRPDWTPVANAAQKKTGSLSSPILALRSVICRAVC